MKFMNRLERHKIKTRIEIVTKNIRRYKISCPWYNNIYIFRTVKGRQRITLRCRKKHVKTGGKNVS